MKVYIRLNGSHLYGSKTTVWAELRAVDAVRQGECSFAIAYDHSARPNTRKFCKEVARKLHQAAIRFELLSEEKDPFSCGAQKRINRKRLP